MLKQLFRSVQTWLIRVIAGDKMVLLNCKIQGASLRFTDVRQVRERSIICDNVITGKPYNGVPMISSRT
jgi:hypothetical protein